MKIIKETIIDQIKLDDLDILIQDELFGENPNGHDYDFICDDSPNKVNWNEGDYIPIQTLLNTVRKLKEAGASHVQIYPHCDHHGYYFTGCKMVAVSGEEAIELQKKKLKREIEIAEGQYEQNKNYLTEQMNEIGMLYEKLEKLNGNIEEEREE